MLKQTLNSYCNAPKVKAKLNINMTTTTSGKCVEMYLSVLKRMLR